MTSRDDLYAVSHETLPPFSFDDRVAAVFPDMIRRSVPGYELILQALPWLAARVVQPGSRVYDLGASLGACAHAVRVGVQCSCNIIAVDSSSSMIARAEELLSGFRSDLPVELVCADVLDIHVQDASLVMLNFTLQFIPIDRRLELLSRIRSGMRPGGILLLSEKIAFPDPDLERLITEIHHDFKRAQGYSELEIAQKRQALDNVLIPELLEVHRSRLIEAGFVSCETWLQHTRFVSMLARVAA
ncbi:MAG: carboxy-S-adenosyl-L-methionine synthase CmoA [Pseudomonadota bacterium]